jgi:hypothetical protein
VKRGKDMIDLAAGDQERWRLHPARSGPPDTRTRPVRITPTDDTRDPATVIMRGKQRRGSHIRLVSRRTGDLVTTRCSGED